MTIENGPATIEKTQLYRLSLAAGARADVRKGKFPNAAQHSQPKCVSQSHSPPLHHAPIETAAPLTPSHSQRRSLTAQRHSIYAGERKRVKKVTETETTIFVYSGGKLVAEYSTATPPASPTVNYTATDLLGSPRVLTDSLGSVVSRRDFLPFGEEIYADGSNRTTANKYTTSGQDTVRKRFTGYEKDPETQLDFAEARMYENRYGRFTAVDPLLASGKSGNPQTFNRFVYVMNNPLLLTDPTGLQVAQDDDDEVINVDTYWDSAKNTFGTYVDYLRSLGVRVEQTIRFTAYVSGGDETGSTGSTPGPARQFGGIVNSTSGRPIDAFNANMETLNQKVIQRVPLLSNLVNAGLAGNRNDKTGFVIEMGMFGVDLGTTVFTGGTGGTIRRGAVEGLEYTSKRLLLGSGDNIANAGGKIRSFVTKEDQTFYRVFSGNSTSGAFLTAIPPKSSAFAIEAFSLPSSNSATFLQQVFVPAGTRLQRSRTLPVPQWNRFRGGGEQFQLLQPIPNRFFGFGSPLQ